MPPFSELSRWFGRQSSRTTRCRIEHGWCLCEAIKAEMTGEPFRVCFDHVFGFASTVTTIVAESIDLRSRSVSGIGLTRCVSCAVIPRDSRRRRVSTRSGDGPLPIRTTASLTNSPCRLDLCSLERFPPRGPGLVGNAAAFRGREVTPHHGLPSENRAARQSEGSVKPLDMSEFPDVIRFALIDEY